MVQMGIEFRIATVADSQTLLTLMREYSEGEGERYDDESTRVALSEILACPEFNRVWLMRDGEEAIGYVVLTLGHSIEYGGRDAFIDELYVRSSHRGRGIGRRALEVAEAAAVELRVQAIHLEVDGDKPAALGLYRKLGFEEHDRLLMTKRLSDRREAAAPRRAPPGPAGRHAPAGGEEG